MREIWKDIKGYEGIYQVSDFGNVKSIKRTVWMKVNNCYKTIGGIVLKTAIVSGGYCGVSLCANNIKETRLIHQLVAIAFFNHTPCKYKIVIDHINNNPLDNRATNLQLITQRENTSKDQSGGTSKYIGVSWAKKKKSWHSRIVINGKLKHLGYFDKEIAAANMYLQELKKL